MRVMILLLFAYISATAYSAKILIHNTPVDLLVHEGYYSFPADYLYPRQDYHFVNLAGTARVCFLMPRVELGNLDAVQVYIQVEGKKLFWNCYRYDRKFFEPDF